MVGTRVPTGTKDGDRLPSSNIEIPQISLLLALENCWGNEERRKERSEPIFQSSTCSGGE